MTAQRPIADSQRIAAVAASSRSGAMAAKAWAAWGPGGPNVGPDGALTWEREDSLAAELKAAASLSHLTGAPLADVLDAVARIEKARAVAARSREVALAGPKASARVLGFLPVAGLALGVIVEPRTLSVMASPLGMAVVVVASVLGVSGAAWMRSMVRAAHRAGDIP